MKNYDVILILVSIFVLRVIVFSAGYADSICLLGLLSVFAVREHLATNKRTSEALVRIESNEAKLRHLAEEMNRVKNSSDGLKAAINLTSKSNR
jgi:hypothetical protein